MCLESKEISFVVQGPFVIEGKNNTYEVCKSIRKHFPLSEIILSTWKQNAIKNLVADKIIYNSDPGFFFDFNNKPVNINRQIVSSFEGIKNASKPYVVKLRSDTLVEGSHLLKKIKSIRSAKLFKNKIVTINLFSRDPLKSFMLFHPSDIFFFGLKLDLLKLFERPLANKEEITPNNHFTPIVPEQYLWMNFLKEQRVLNDYSKHSSFNIYFSYLSERVFFENFIVCDYANLGLTLPEHIVHGVEPKRVYNSSLQFWMSSDLTRLPLIYIRCIFFGFFRFRSWAAFHFLKYKKSILNNRSY